VKNGIDHHKADLIFASVPYKIMAPLPGAGVRGDEEARRRPLRRLEKAGFMLDFGVDGSGLFMKYLRRGSGYYIDVGASELVANGSIKLKSRVNIERINPKSVTLTDGSELPADLLVYATGYGSMNQLAGRPDLTRGGRPRRQGLGPGLDTPKDPGPWEGELRNMWKPTQVPHLWFHGGNLHQSRHYSQFLSLQLKARWPASPRRSTGWRRAPQALTTPRLTCSEKPCRPRHEGRPGSIFSPSRPRAPACVPRPGCTESIASSIPSKSASTLSRR
jgi:putative flavoprotein involved in K+ transport